VILKMMLLLILFDVRSERELMETIPMRLDWLWFLGYDLDSEVADHSVLSKARARWGVEAFRNIFERIVRQEIYEAHVIAHQPAEPRLRGTQEGLRGLSDPRAVYSEQVGADDQAAFAARGVGPDAGGESFISGEAGHQDEAASDGAFFCQRDMV
jgi:IS5 family transposase